MLIYYPGGLPDRPAPIWAPALGLTLNIPASEQLWPNWWVQEPERYAKLLAARAEHGITVDNDLGEGNV